MDGRTTTLFLALVLILTGVSVYADEYCYVKSIWDFMCTKLACKFDCWANTRQEHGEVKDLWCTGKWFQRYCHCRICIRDQV
ncbi:hypothetical protein ACP70R_021457 [Stipagrostis hirtigluma subsp. patula]